MPIQSSASLQQGLYLLQCIQQYILHALSVEMLAFLNTLQPISLQQHWHVDAGAPIKVVLNIPKGLPGVTIKDWLPFQ